MSAHASDGAQAPAIDVVQHNVEGVEHSFGGDEPLADEHAADFAHSGESVRLVLDNGNWIEYHRLGEETIVECVFERSELPDGTTEHLLENRLKLHDRSVGTAEAFLETVDTSIEVYRREIDTVDDAAGVWDNIVPAVEGHDG